MSDTKNIVTAGPVIAAFLASSTRSVPGADCTIEYATACDAAIAYLLEYGFSQAIGDTQAVGEKGILAAAISKGTLPKGTVDVPDTEAFKTWAQSFLRDRATARLSAILDGDMVFGRSERLSPEDRDRRDLTLASLKDAAGRQGMKLPKGAAELQPLLDYVYEAEKATIEAEVARRAKVRAKPVTADLSGLAALLKAAA